MQIMRGKSAALDRNENFIGYMFALPSLVGFLIFSLFPLLLTVVLSFSKWDLVSGFHNIKLIGIANYKDLIGDSEFIDSFRNNLLFTLMTIPTQIIGGLFFAILINKYCFGKNLFKVIYFLPYISSIVAISTVWAVIFAPSYGPVTETLHALGVANPPKWLGDPHWVLPIISMMYVWQNIGYFIIIYISGLQSIPLDLYEAADIDGANWFQRLKSITIPMVSPTTFFLLITGIISSFKVFDQIQVLTEGGPGDASSVLVYYLYKVAFRFYKMGYGSAIAMVLFVVVFIITYLQWQGQKKWVNYL